MRLLSRHAPVDEIVTPVENEKLGDAMEVPLKAQKLLGEKPRINYRIQGVVTTSGDGAHGDIIIPPKARKLLGEKGHVKNNRKHQLKHSSPDSLWHIRDAEQRSLQTLSEADSDTVPGAKSGAPLPVVQVAMGSSEDRIGSSNDSTGQTGTSTYVGHQPSIDSISREYYDASKHPLYVSQQTSESSVRDMRLHKGTPPVSDTASNTASDAPLISRPFMNALKYRRPGNDRVASDEPKRPRKIDLTSLFPHPKTSNGVMSSFKPSARSPPVATPFSEFFPKDTIHAQFNKYGSKTHLEKDQPVKSLPKQPLDSNGERVKVFESDIYDSKKTHVRRPPKGTQNWFDALDISSDEDDNVPEPVREGPPPVELPANEVTRAQEALPSVFSPWGPPMREFTAPRPQTSEGGHEIPLTPPERNPKRRSKQRRRSSNSQTPKVVNNAAAEMAADSRRGGESRLAHSRLGAQSVLSLSSGSGGEEVHSPAVDDNGANDNGANDNVTFEKASPREMQRPLGPARKLDRSVSESKAHAVESATQRSKTVREKATQPASPPRVPSRGNGSLISDSSPAARRKPRGSTKSPEQSLPLRRRTNESVDRDAIESIGDETSSSVPTEASRMMAVTEEEMILLELMRQKRAEMQKVEKDSYSEGYRVAVQDERRNQASRQGFVDEPSLIDHSKRADRSGLRSRDTNKSVIMLREELEHRRRMSSLRKEDVDRAFKMERFLAREPPNEDRQPKIERFLAMAPGLSGEFGGRPISGTEIEIDSRYGETEDRVEEADTSFDEKEDDTQEDQDDEIVTSEDPTDSDSFDATPRPDEGELVPQDTPKQTHIFSPMQRLTDQVRSRAEVKPQIASQPVRDPFDKVAPFPVPTRKIESPAITALPAMPADDIRETSIPYDREGNELLSPKVYTPSIGSEKTPKLPKLDTLPDGPTPLEYKIDSPDTPVATTWARPSSLKHPRPQRQPVGLDFTPLETQPIRTAPPSIATSRPSPLSTTFEPAPLSPSDTIPEDVDAETPNEVNSSSPKEPFSPKGNFPRFPNPLKSHPISPAIDTKSLKSSNSSTPASFRPKPGRITSMASITSAGEDVLAAWAELGGGRADALVFKRKKTV